VPGPQDQPLVLIEVVEAAHVERLLCRARRYEDPEEGDLTARVLAVRFHHAQLGRVAGERCRTVLDQGTLDRL
jgi:hypothetical protein